MLEGQPAIFDLNPYEQSSVQMHKLGAKGETGDGRIFRYAQMGEAVTLGYLTQSPAIDTATITMAVTTAAAIGAESITFTHGATTSAANEYAEGFLSVSYGTGIGQNLKISDHLAWTSAQTGAVVNLEDPLIVALDTTSKIDVAHNPWNGVLMDTSQVTVPTGVALRSFTSAYYGWLQTRGVCGVFSDGTITAGYEFNNDGSVAGAIDISATNEFQRFPVGHAIQAGAQNYVHQVYLTID
jgi:hypothetical protein